MPTFINNNKHNQIDPLYDYGTPTRLLGDFTGGVNPKYTMNQNQGYQPIRALETYTNPYNPEEGGYYMSGNGVNYVAPVKASSGNSGGGSGGNTSGVVADYKANLNNLYNNVMNYGAYTAGTYTPGRYVSQYDTSEIEGKLKGWLNEIDNYEQFKYDLNADMLYKQYVDNAMMQGQTAMQDTMAQAAALTGGYGNSYAAAVGNQAYQNYITQANNNIPAFQQMAMNVWQSGLDQLMNQYNAGTQQLNNLLNLDAQALARWQANENLAFSAWQANEQNAYNQWLAGYNQVNDQYGTGKDYYGTLMELEKASGGGGSGSSGNKASTTTSTSNLPASVQNVLNNATQAQLVTAEDWVKLLDEANKRK